MINYFNFLTTYRINHIYMRKHRLKLKGLKNVFIFSVGDILKIIYFRKIYLYIFEGICISIKKKSFLMPNVSFILRNIVLGISIEIIFLFFSNRLYFLKIKDYKRKFNTSHKNKLFYLRFRNNQASYVNFFSKKKK